MHHYTIVYKASNSYSADLSEAFLEYLIYPCENDTQKLLEVSIESTPRHEAHFSSNFYGMKTLRFSIRKNTPSFDLYLHAVVEKTPFNPFDFIPLPLETENEILMDVLFKTENYFFLQQTEYTHPGEKLFIINRNKDESVFDFAQRVNTYCYKLIEYDLGHASIHNSIDTILGNKKGVCQDYTHLMISIVRANNIPARYVSGYLHQGHGFEGDNAIHAWVEVLVPQVGWIGFDPTNNLLVNEFYIKIAHGVDLNECQSLRGVIRSAGTSETKYRVQVTGYEQSKQSNQ